MEPEPPVRPDRSGRCRQQFREERREAAADRFLKLFKNSQLFDERPLTLVVKYTCLDLPLRAYVQVFLNVGGMGKLLLPQDDDHKRKVK